MCTSQVTRWNYVMPNPVHPTNGMSSQSLRKNCALQQPCAHNLVTGQMVLLSGQPYNCNTVRWACNKHKCMTCISKWCCDKCMWCSQMHAVYDILTRTIDRNLQWNRSMQYKNGESEVITHRIRIAPLQQSLTTTSFGHFKSDTVELRDAQSSSPNKWYVKPITTQELCPSATMCTQSCHWANGLTVRSAI